MIDVTFSLSADELKTAPRFSSLRTRLMLEAFFVLTKAEDASNCATPLLLVPSYALPALADILKLTTCIHNEQ
jgi:hypothetical protein